MQVGYDSRTFYDYGSTAYFYQGSILDFAPESTLCAEVRNSSSNEAYEIPYMGEFLSVLNETAEKLDFFNAYPEGPPNYVDENDWIAMNLSSISQIRNAVYVLVKCFSKLAGTNGLQYSDRRLIKRSGT